MTEREELEAYFRAQTNIRLSSIETKLDEMRIQSDKKFDQLINFRAMLIGGSIAASAIISTAILIIFGR